jgi:hypothetical protein
MAENITGTELQLPDNPRAEIIEALGAQYNLIK